MLPDDGGDGIMLTNIDEVFFEHWRIEHNGELLVRPALVGQGSLDSIHHP
ncbi:MAG: hypothetical protein ABIP62_06605 [Vicinamibacteria bacterium]